MQISELLVRESLLPDRAAETESEGSVKVAEQQNVLTKAELKILERAFACEIEGRIFQTKSRLAQKLVDERYLRPVEERVSVPPLGVMTIKGYGLTLLGNFTYCMSCDSPDADERISP
jgi:hypothetical protein